jgi:hypothetical protein
MMMKKQCLFVAAALACLAIPSAANATVITATIGNSSSGFTNGSTQTPLAVLTAQTVPPQPAPFNGPCGTDPTVDCDALWTFTYVIPSGETITAGTLSLGIFDIDAAAAGDQVALYQINGGDILTATLNTAANAAASTTNHYDIFTFALSSFGVLSGGSATVHLTLQGPGLGALGTTVHNGGSLVYSQLQLTTQPSGGAEVPEPATLLLLASGLGTVIRSRRKARV